MNVIFYFFSFELSQCFFFVYPYFTATCFYENLSTLTVKFSNVFITNSFMTNSSWYEKLLTNSVLKRYEHVEVQKYFFAKDSSIYRIAFRSILKKHL